MVKARIRMSHSYDDRIRILKVNIFLAVLTKRIGWFEHNRETVLVVECRLKLEELQGGRQIELYTN